MTRDLLSSVVRCDMLGCIKTTYGDAKSLTEQGWELRPSVLFFHHLCPDHHTVQDSGHQPKETPVAQSAMSSSTTNSAAEFIRIRQRIVSILIDDLTMNDSSPITDKSEFNFDSLEVAAEDIMLTFRMEMKNEDAD